MTGQDIAVWVWFFVILGIMIGGATLIAYLIAGYLNRRNDGESRNS